MPNKNLIYFLEEALMDESWRTIIENLRTAQTKPINTKTHT